MTKYAITPKGVGNRPGVRAIRDGWEPKETETFVLTEAPDPSQVLDESGIALRDKTPDEVALEEVDRITEQEEGHEQDEILRDTKGGPLFGGLKRATPPQINTFVDNQFDTFTPSQRNVLKLLLRVAILSLRRLK